MTGRQKKNSPGRGDDESGVSGLLKGLANLVGNLGDLAEKGAELKRSGEFGSGSDGRGIKGVYGFSVRTGLGGDRGIEVEPFGNIRKDGPTGEAAVHETREPMTDVFEEANHVLVVAEMAGVGPGDIRIEIQDDVMSITASNSERKYRKELLLPGTFDRDKMTVTCNNGVVEIRLAKRGRKS